MKSTRRSALLRHAHGLRGGASVSGAAGWVGRAAACLKQHGYAGAAVQPLCAGAAASSAALAKVGEAGRARGELVVPKA